jgi:hypothetical protein
MNDAVNRFIQEMGAVYASEGDRDVSPILFKADDEPDGMIFELTLPKGESHPYWRVRERQMTPQEVTGIAAWKDTKVLEGAWHIKTLVGSEFRVRGYVYNARERGKWNLSVGKAD